MRRQRWLLQLGLVAVAGAGLATSAALAGPAGDYGDAADPTFPALSASNGPVHLDVSREWIGTGAVSTTTTEADSLQVNQDADSGCGWWVRRPDANGLVKSWFVTRVSFDRTLSTAQETRYLNVLADLDGSGSWGNASGEWAVRNLRVPFEALPAEVNTLTVICQMPSTVVPEQMIDRYTRVTLSERTVSESTGGWGQFDRGETEDWIGARIDEGIVGGSAPLSLKPMPAPVLTGTPNAVCDICGIAGIALPLHGTWQDPRAGWRWTLSLPPSTTHLMVKMIEDGRDGDQALCPDSYLSLGALRDPVFGPTLPVGVLSGDLINHATPVPAANAFTEWGGLMSPHGHTSVQFFYGIVYDPMGEYVYLWGNGELAYNPIPEPSTLVLLIAVLPALLLRRSRLH